VTPSEKGDNPYAAVSALVVPAITAVSKPKRSPPTEAIRATITRCALGRVLISVIVPVGQAAEAGDAVVQAVVRQAGSG